MWSWSGIVPSFTFAQSGGSYNLLCYLVKKWPAGTGGRAWDDDLVRDEDDHDLLTFAESGIRLREEISLTEAALREGPDRGAAGRAQARLSALTEALAPQHQARGGEPGREGVPRLRSPAPGRTDDAEAES